MGYKFLDLRDMTGRSSTVGIFDGEGSCLPSIRIIGVLPHGTEFTVQEFGRFARAFLEAQGEPVESDSLLYHVGRNDDKAPFAVFRTRKDAESFVAVTLTDGDPEGVAAGDYYIDGPETPES